MCAFKKFRTRNIGIKFWKKIPLYSIRWSESKIELLLFKFIPLLWITTPRKYVQLEEDVWVAM